MLGLNTDQIMGQIRHILSGLGAVAVTLGIMSAGAVEAWTQVIVSIVGAALLLGGLIWSLFAHTNASTVAAAAAIPEVQKIETVNSPEGRALKASVPDSREVVVAPAGTGQPVTGRAFGS